MKTVLRLATLALVLTLSTSCVTRTIRLEPLPCLVPPWPEDPVLELREDGELTDQSFVNLGLWIRDVIRYKVATDRCPNVKVVTDAEKVTS